MLTPQHRLAILLHEGITGTTGKTGLALLRFSQAEIVAVIDKQSAGQSLTKLTGIPRNIPIVASLQEALTYNPNVLAIGIAPSGGALPPPNGSPKSNKPSKQAYLSQTDCTPNSPPKPKHLCNRDNGFGICAKNPQG